MTSGKSDQSASPARRTPSFALSVHPRIPTRFAPRPQNTPYNTYPRQYVMSWHPPPPQNQLSQLHAYHGYHPLEPYPPTRYFSHLRHQPQPYLQHQSSVRGGDPSYQQAGRLPPPTVQFAAGGPTPSYARPYGGVQQCSPPYRPPVQPSVYQSYYGPRPSADMFIRGNPTHIQQQNYPISYSPPWVQCPRRDPDTLVAQSTGSDPLSLPSRAPSNSSTAVTTSRNTIDISSTTDSPSEHSVRGSQNVDAHRLGQNPAASTTFARVHTSDRRHYHPNPPPDRSEWVMWVGNIPSDATEDELGQFLARPASLTSGSEANDAGVMSIFLISRSKCAFVNYQSKEHLNRAISRFDRRKLRPHDRRCPPLVCRARRKEDDLRAGVGAQRGMGIHARHVKNVLQKGGKSPIVSEETADGRSDPSDLPPSASNDDEIPKSDTVEGANHKFPTQSPSSFASTSSSFLARHFPKRFFILKSLTRYDLDLSTDRGVWATQKHNEAILDQAFRTSMEVTLIFSVNKSGEFYGYARMASGISRGDRSISWAPRVDSLPSASQTSTSRVSTYGPQQQPSPSYPSQTYTSPSERQSAEVTLVSFTPFPDEAHDCPSLTSLPLVKSLPERRSAPPALDPPPGSGRQGWSQQSQGSDPPSTTQLQSKKLPRMHAVVGSISVHGADNSGNLESRLLPVVEETHSESGVEENQPAQMALLPSVTRTHGHSEDQERVASWGETFKVDWLCTQRVQFHRTRHLRNPWNHGREIKVSRDGTELEPSVGQQLVDSWSALASEPASGYDARRSGKSVPKPRLQRNQNASSKNS